MGRNKEHQRLVDEGAAAIREAIKTIIGSDIKLGALAKVRREIKTRRDALRQLAAAKERVRMLEEKIA